MIHHQFIREVLAAACAGGDFTIVPLDYRLLDKRDLPPPSIKPVEIIFPNECD